MSGSNLEKMFGLSQGTNKKTVRNNEVFVLSGLNVEEMFGLSQSNPLYGHPLNKNKWSCIFPKVVNVTFIQLSNTVKFRN